MINDTALSLHAPQDKLLIDLFYDNVVLCSAEFSEHVVFQSDVVWPLYTSTPVIVVCPFVCH